MPSQVYLRSDTCSERGLLREVVRGSSNIIITPSSSNQSTVEPKEYANGYGTLQFSAFRCNQLPPCIVTCDGPDEALIRYYNVGYLIQYQYQSHVCITYITYSYVTKHCSCMVEWYFNGYMVTIALAAAVYLLLNISR